MVVEAVSDGDSHSRSALRSSAADYVFLKGYTLTEKGKPPSLQTYCGGRVAPIDTALFEGKLLASVVPRSRVGSKQVQAARAEGGGYVLSQKGKVRGAMCTFQGRFKERIRFVDLVAGFYFERQLVNMPAQWLMSRLIDLVRMLAFPVLVHDIFGDEPFFHGPLISMMDTVAIHRPGQEPSLTSNEDLQEDTTLLWDK